jgi:hypothetical protein
MCFGCTNPRESLLPLVFACDLNQLTQPELVRLRHVIGRFEDAGSYSGAWRTRELLRLSLLQQITSSRVRAENA